jgi:hypothetical protein
MTMPKRITPLAAILAVAVGALLLAPGRAMANCSLVPGNLPTAPDARFVDNGNTTITDISTGLMWSQAVQGAAVTHAGALSLAEASTLGSFTDWRLPTRAELVGLVESACVDPAFNTSRFNDGGLRVIWSASAGPGATFWFVDFTYGSDAVEPAGARKGVRLVRNADGGIFANGFE